LLYILEEIHPQREHGVPRHNQVALVVVAKFPGLEVHQEVLKLLHPRDKAMADGKIYELVNDEQDVFSEARSLGIGCRAHP
jgi:hypothetical protein